MPKANREFCEQIQAAFQTLGEEEALKCMARSLLYMAMKNKCAFSFKCDEGDITVNINQLHLHG